MDWSLLQYQKKNKSITIKIKFIDEKKHFTIKNKKFSQKKTKKILIYGCESLFPKKKKLQNERSRKCSKIKQK